MTLVHQSTRPVQIVSAQREKKVAYALVLGDHMAGSAVAWSRFAKAAPKSTAGGFQPPEPRTWRDTT
ncbi:MAG: hypothetical protein ACKOEH_01795 [Actinomycetota bacterium]